MRLWKQYVQSSLSKPDAGSFMPKVVSTCGAASGRQVVGVEERPALQLARSEPALVAGRRADSADYEQGETREAAEGRHHVSPQETRFDRMLCT